MRQRRRELPSPSLSFSNVAAAAVVVVVVVVAAVRQNTLLLLLLIHLFQPQPQVTQPHARSFARVGASLGSHGGDFIDQLASQIVHYHVTHHCLAYVAHADRRELA